MSIEIMTDVWKHAPCLANDLLVLLALADSANDDRDCWPSLRTIAKKTRITLKECLLIVQDLSLQGFIEIEHRKDARRSNLSNKYHIRKMEDWLLLWAYNLLNPIIQDKGGVFQKLPQSETGVFQKLPQSETGVFQTEGEKVTESSVESSVESKEKRKRSTPRTKSIDPEPIHPLIQAWATIRKIDVANIGAPIYSRNDLALAKRMAKWDVPPTCDEITFAIQSSKAPQKYQFRYLESDIPQHRLAKTPPSVATTATGETYFEHARRQGRAMFFGEDE